MRAKYGVKLEDRAHFRLRNRASQIWKGVTWRGEGGGGGGAAQISGEMGGAQW